MRLQGFCKSRSQRPGRPVPYRARRFWVSEPDQPNLAVAHGPSNDAPSPVASFCGASTSNLPELHIRTSTLRFVGRISNKHVNSSKTMSRSSKRHSSECAATCVDFTACFESAAYKRSKQRHDSRSWRDSRDFDPSILTCSSQFWSSRTTSFALC